MNDIVALVGILLVVIAVIPIARWLIGNSPDPGAGVPIIGPVAGWLGGRSDIPTAHH
jgi:hypothetical protein